MNSLLVLSLVLKMAPEASAQDIVRVTGLTPEASSKLPDIYVVQPGDTLWNISTRFLGTAENWPRLWSINEQITNPHWIYPGNRIVFVPGTLIEPPGMGLEPGETFVRDGFVSPTVAFEEGQVDCGPDRRFDEPMHSGRYNAHGLLEDGESVELLGRVYKARTEALAQAERDIIYLELDDPGIAECGDIVSVLHRVERAVRHPEGGARYGALYRVAGEARILYIEDDIATAVIRRSWSEIERGDLLTVRVPTSVELEVDPPKGSIEGTIVAMLDQEEAVLLSIGEVVFLDRGRADGVRVGNSFYAVERRDEYLDAKSEDPRLPQSVIARVVVVRVDERSSTGVVVQAARHLQVGTHVTQQLE